MRLLYLTTFFIFIVIIHKIEANGTYVLDENEVSLNEKVNDKSSGFKSHADLDDNEVSFNETSLKNSSSRTNNVSSLEKPVEVTKALLKNKTSGFKSPADLDDNEVSFNETSLNNGSSQSNNVFSLEKPTEVTKTLVNNKRSGFKSTADLDDKTQITDNEYDIYTVSFNSHIETVQTTQTPSKITQKMDLNKLKENEPQIKDISLLSSQIFTVDRHDISLGCRRIASDVNGSINNSWKAVPKSQPNADSGFKHLTFKGILPLEDQPLCPTAECRLPRAYDTRTSYPMCVFLQDPLDQGCHCRAGWAVGAVSALSDRFCIATGGALDQQFSAQNVLSCCDYCGRCDGSFSEDAWRYLLDPGVMSGSPYGHTTGCQPYLIKPCLVEDETLTLIKTPTCSNTCRTSSKNSPLFFYKASRVYTLRNTSANAIKEELFFRGPVTADINVYEDLECYKSGIYNHVTGSHLGYKTVKLVGWGEEKGVPYWVAANTWGSSWGENGFFRIRMDVENIIAYVSAGIPHLFEIATAGYLCEGGAEPAQVLMTAVGNTLRSSADGEPHNRIPRGAMACLVAYARKEMWPALNVWLFSQSELICDIPLQNEGLYL